MESHTHTARIGMGEKAREEGAWERKGEKKSERSMIAKALSYLRNAVVHCYWRPQGRNRSKRPLQREGIVEQRREKKREGLGSDL